MSRRTPHLLFSLFVLPFSALMIAGCQPSFTGGAPVATELQAALEVYDMLDAYDEAVQEEALLHAEEAGIEGAESLARMQPFSAVVAEALAEALPSFRDSLLHDRLRDLLDTRLSSWSAVERDALWTALLELRFAPRRETPPVETGEFRDADLVELILMDSTLKLDIRYATEDNFAGRQVYDTARAFLQRPAAEAVVRVSAALREQGLGLIVYDGYRPWSVTRIFWDLTPDAQKQFVADPDRGSRHNRGCAVDLGLYDLSTGEPLPMPSDYDDFSERAYPTYAGGTAEERANRDLLIEAMRAEGFETYPTEWWHFDYKDWREYRILNVSFDALDP